MNFTQIPIIKNIIKRLTLIYFHIQNLHQKINPIHDKNNLVLKTL